MTEEAKPKGLDLLDMEINIWMPMKPGGDFLAMIGPGTVLFRAKSAIEVRKRANEWRNTERAKFLAKQATAADKARIAANREGQE